MILNLADFLNLTQKAKSIDSKCKNNKWPYKLKNIWAIKETINRVNRQPMEWGEIFTNCLSDKGLMSRI